MAEQPFNPQEFLEKAKAAAKARPMTEDDFYYLVSRYPYLEIADINTEFFAPSQTPEFIKAKNGWVIHNTGNILRAAQPELIGLLHYGYDLSHAGIETELFGKHDVLQKDEGDGDGESGVGELKPCGTIVNQLFTVAFEMIDVAQHMWSACQIIRGYYPMQRAAWIASQHREYKLEGFEPSPEDEVVSNWIENITPHSLKRSVRASIR